MALAPLALVVVLASPPGPRVPVAENFSDGELIGMYLLVTADVAAFIFQRPLAEARDPLLGEPWDWDRRVSESLYRPGKGPFMEGVPDLFGNAIAPALTLGLYGLDGFAAAFGDPLWGRHADHELLTLVEAYAVTLGLTQAAKLGIGRLRPEYQLERPERPMGVDPERTLSFFSGHSSSSFCLAAFVSRDVGDWLTRGGAGPLAARVLPSVVFYGAAGLVAYSRVVDQKHYLTDVGVGALVGAATGSFFYWLHFDDEGRPRRRHPGRLRVLALPGGVSLSGSF